MCSGIRPYLLLADLFRLYSTIYLIGMYVQWGLDHQEKSEL